MKLPFGYKIEKATAPKAPQRPMGLVGLKVASGFVQEEFLTELQWPQAGKVYQEMASNDAVIGGCLYLIETLIRKAHWHAKAASDEPGDLEAATFLESCMYDMQDQSWDDFVCDVLSMLTYGFSFHEVVYKVRRGPLEKDPKFRSNFTDGKIGWQELPVRSQASLSEWTYDEATGKVTEFVQDPSIVGVKGDLAKIPIEGNLLFKTKSARGNPEGWSILRRAYRSWYFKRYIEELEGIGIERNLAGIPTIAPPPDVPLFDKENDEMRTMLDWAQKLVNELRQDRNHGVVLPSTDWDLKLLGAEGSSKAMDTDTIIRRHESRMAMSMLSDIVIMGGDRTGSFALAETKQGLFIASLQAIINSIAYCLNTRAVPKLFAVNGWTLEKLPTIVADDLKAPSISEIALLLRSFKVDITKDKNLFNFILTLMQAPEMTQDQFDAFMAAQSAGNPDNGDGTDPDDPDGEGTKPNPEFQDGADNDAKQSDLSYT
jgi:hypothetical protein